MPAKGWVNFTVRKQAFTEIKGEAHKRGISVAEMVEILWAFYQRYYRGQVKAVEAQ